MNKLLIVAIACVLAVASANTLSDVELQGEFVSFMKTHAKTYTPDEMFFRFTIFKSNLEYINTHNAGESSFTMAVNQFADMTNAEFKDAMTGNLIPREDFFTGAQADLPEPLGADIDWVAKGKVTPVKNQGQCGSCWAFSTTGSVEAAESIKSGDAPLPLSEQCLVDCAGLYGNQGCNGGLMDNAFKYIQANGICSEEAYPYVAKGQWCKPLFNKTYCSTVAKISGYSDVTPKDEDKLQAAIEQQPVSIAIEADQQAFQFYSSGIFDAACGTQLDHGVLLVGAGSEGGVGYWKVKNSWGATWGDAGYIRLKKGMNDGAGQCGIAMQPSFPTA